MLREAAQEFSPELEFVRFNADRGFSLQFPALLAPLWPGESDAEVQIKVRLVARYFDIGFARRVWYYRSLQNN